MRHRKKHKILDRASSQRRALIINLLRSLMLYEKIKTTEAKAKLIKPLAERLITMGKINSLSVRRNLINKIGSNALAEKIMKEISPRFVKRPGGYTRIIKIGSRQGDAAQLVYLTLIKS